MRPDIMLVFGIGFSAACGAISWYRGCPPVCWTLFGYVAMVLGYALLGQPGALMFGFLAIGYVLWKTKDLLECPSCGEEIPSCYLRVGRCPECKAKFKLVKGELHLLKQKKLKPGRAG